MGDTTMQIKTLKMLKHEIEEIKDTTVVLYTDEWFRVNMKFFNIWYDEGTFDWKEGSLYMAKYGHLVHNVIENAKNWDGTEIQLTNEWFVENARYFDEWWPGSKNFEYQSGVVELLAKFVPHKFKLWWCAEADKTITDVWELSSLVSGGCGQYLPEWWDKRFADMLADRGDVYYITALADKCHLHTELWWDKRFCKILAKDGTLDKSYGAFVDEKLSCFKHLWEVETMIHTI